MVTDEKKREYVRRLIFSRMRLLNTHGFFGLLLMHTEFALDFEIETAATDGDKIYFSPKFMDELSDQELDFVLMHEIMHMALRHCVRAKDKDPFLFNIACDVVVNSNILLSSDMDEKSITLKKWGVSMHLAPDHKEGFNYTAEEVYEMLLDKASKKKGKSALGMGSGSGSGSGGKSDSKNGSSSSSSGGSGDNKKDCGSHGWDEHGKWKEKKEDFDEDEQYKEAVWNKRVKDAIEATEIRNACTGRGTVPLLAKRRLQELTEAQTDWRTILSAFVQEEIVDYSFSPPDKRYGDSPFYLPDFNDTDVVLKDILFMIDTSASMSDKMITAAYSEVKGAIDQFGGKLKGLLGFFDASVVPPEPFEDEETFKIIKPLGGGGTNFACIFNYVKNNMADNLPASIIVLTDGYAPFPSEESALGVPVLWVINNEKVEPPWGRVARIKA